LVVEKEVHQIVALYSVHDAWKCRHGATGVAEEVGKKEMFAEWNSKWKKRNIVARLAFGAIFSIRCQAQRSELRADGEGISTTTYFVRLTLRLPIYVCCDATAWPPAMDDRVPCAPQKLLPRYRTICEFLRGMEGGLFSNRAATRVVVMSMCSMIVHTLMFTIEKPLRMQRLHLHVDRENKTTNKHSMR
jgi:hypothetical protein